MRVQGAVDRPAEGAGVRWTPLSRRLRSADRAGRRDPAAQQEAAQQEGQTLVVAVVTTLLPEKMLTLAPFLSNNVAFLAPTITGLFRARQTIAA